MTDKLRGAAQMALEALNGYPRVVAKLNGLTYAMGDEAITALREALAEPQSNIEFLYEELRKATDGGSESMNHYDALKQVQYWRERAEQWVGMRWLPVNPSQDMEKAFYKSLKEHGTKNFFPVWIDLINVACANEYGHDYFPPLKEAK
jgi:hypothetical protein